MGLASEFQSANVRPQGCFPVQNGNCRKAVLDKSDDLSPATRAMMLAGNAERAGEAAEGGLLSPDWEAGMKGV
jgi:hypothetical protein